MKNLAYLTIATSMTFVLAACGSGGGDAAQADGQLQKVQVGAVPVVDVAALYIGENQGFFEEEGLDLEIEFGQGSAAMIPALTNGQYDLLYGGSINALQATDKDLPLVAIGTGGKTTGEQGNDHGGTLVMPDSGIEDAGDLEGKTVAVNALRGLHEVAMWAAIRDAGGDPTKVSFVELGLPDMAAALEAGRVDAVATSEPFLGVIQEQGAELIASQFVDADEDFVTAIYFTTVEKTESNPEMIEGFRRALDKSFEYAAENPDAVRAELGNFTEIDEGLTDTMVLTRFDSGLTTEDLRLVADLAADANSLDDPQQATDAIAAYIEENPAQG